MKKFANIKMPTNSKIIKSTEFEKNYKKLNADQKLAVDSIEGPVMVVAGPGTGKTTVLTLRIAKILLETDTPAQSILALTFTDSAVSAMRRKLEKMIGSRADQISIFTFHSFCSNLIGHYPEYYQELRSSQKLSETEPIQIIEKIIDQSDFILLKPVGEPHYYVKQSIGLIGKIKKEGIDPEKYLETLKKIRQFGGEKKSKEKDFEKKIKRDLEFAELYRKYENYLRTNHLYDYDDLLLFTVKALEKNKEFLSEVQENFLYILADEHQDANGVQNRIIELISSYFDSPNLFIVGDEKQAIFRFQGASLENFTYFQNKFKKTKVIYLKNNYRSHQKIIDTAFSLLSATRETGEIEKQKLKGLDWVGEKADLVPCLKTQDEAVWVAQKAKELIKSGVKAEEICVIYRENRFADNFVRAFEKRQIPTFLISDQNLLDFPESQVILALLTTICFPDNDQSVFRFLMSEYSGLEKIEVGKISTQAEKTGKKIFEVLGDSKEEKSLKLYNKIKNLQKNILFQTAPRMLEKIFNEFEIYQSILEDKRSFEERKACLEYFFDLVEKLKTKNEFPTVMDLCSELNYLKKYEISIPWRKKDIEGSTVLTTAHRSKGLEFEYVFITGLNSGIWGKRKKRGGISLVLPEEEIDENDERRLLFVSMTRAKKHFYMTYHQFGSDDHEKLSSPFISEINPELINKIQKTFSSGLNLKEEIKLSKSFSDQKDSNLIFSEYIKNLFREKSLSVTALNNFLECPKKYLIRNLLKLSSEMSLDQIYGTAIHNTISEILISENLDLNKIKKFFKDYIWNQILTLQEKSLLLEKAQPIWPNLKKTILELKSKNKIKSEYSVSNVFHLFNKEKISLKGKLDLVVYEKDSIKVFDFKTSKPVSRSNILGQTKNSKGNLFRQLVFYKYLIESEGDLNMSEGSIVFVNEEPKIETFEITKLDIDRLKQEINGMIESIISGSILQSQCSQEGCEYCEMF